MREPDPTVRSLIPMDDCSRARIDDTKKSITEIFPKISIDILKGRYEWIVF